MTSAGNLAEWQAAQKRFQALVVLGDTGVLGGDTNTAEFALWSHRRWAAREALGWPATVRLAAVVGAAGPLIVASLWASSRYDTTGLLLSLAIVMAVQIVVAANAARSLRLRFGRHTEPVAVIALYRRPSAAADPPTVVVEVSPADADRLAFDGVAPVIGDVKVDGHFGIVDDDYVIWPTAPPRLPAIGEPTWGADPDWE